MDISCKSRDSQLRITVGNGSETLGYIVIDSIIGGHAYGGLRFMPEIDNVPW
jgi:hypothetical protein